MDLSSKYNSKSTSVTGSIAKQFTQPCADTEANKTLQAALNQMEGIISGE